MATTEMATAACTTITPAPAAPATTAHGTAARADLSLLLGDFDREVFFARHWERRSLHIRHGDPRRYAHLISPESFFETEVKRCGHLKASTRAADGWNVEIPIRPDQAA